MRVNRRLQSKRRFDKKRFANKAQTRKPRIVRYAAFFIVFVIFAFGIYSLISWYRERYKHYIEVYNNFTPAFAPGDNYRVRRSVDLSNTFNTLIVGLDKKDEGLIKSDMIVIAHYDSVSSLFQIFELPTQTLFYWPDKKTYVTLSNVYALGQLESPASGMDSLIEVLESNLAIKIDIYAATDLTGLDVLADRLSTIVVQNEYAFTDNDLSSLGLRNSFDSGKIRFNDRKDLSAFVMADEGGFTKTSARHFSVIKSLADVVTINFIYQFIADFDNIESHVFSNIDPVSMRSIVSALVDRESDYLQFLNLSDRTINITFEDGGLSVFDTASFDEFILSSIKNEDIEREQARIEVFNATDVPNLASSYSRLLKNLGCDVIRTANNDGTFEKTVVFVSEPSKFESTIKRITDSLGSEIQVVNDTAPFPTTGDIIVVISYDLAD